MTETRLKFQAAFDVFYRVITGMSTSEIDGISRSAAMKLLGRCPQGNHQRPGRARRGTATR